MSLEDAFFKVEDDEFYLSQKHKSDLKKQDKCEHRFFVCKCSICGKILGSEKNIKL